MIHSERFESASGLRPLSAFVVVAAVLLAVAGHVSWRATGERPEPPRPLRTERGLTPSHAIVDAEGRMLARTIESASLEAWSRSLWQAHTPERIAARLSDALAGEPPADELLARMLPSADADGAVTADWFLDDAEARAVRQWIASGAEREGGPLAGVQLEPARVERYGASVLRWRLVWRPAVLLSADERARHGYRTALGWTRHLARSLAAGLPARMAALASVGEGLNVPECALWKPLMPVDWCSPVFDVPPARMTAVRDALRAEGVQVHQAALVRRSERVHPAGELGVLGVHGFANLEQREAAGLSGLERLTAELLERDEWAIVRAAPSRYAWLDTRSTRGGGKPRYRTSSEEASAPVVRTSLDLDLLAAVGAELDATMAEHRPAIAMALVIDVASARVLAVDARSEYPLQPFAPVFWRFTPGSTFKTINVALALERGLTHADEIVDVGHGAWRVPGTGRHVHEAEHAPTGRVDVRWAFAKSINSGMVQLGLRVAPADYRGTMERLGYGLPPGAGMGAELAGALPPLRVWTPADAHTSACFGRGFSTTLWQHAASLATVVRGGVHLPLSLVEGVSANGRFHPARPVTGERVFSEETCAEVRSWMELGAREGTGRRIRRDDLVMGTKTGTAHKDEGQVCVHVSQEQRALHHAEARTVTDADYDSWRGLPKPHPNCYTSSMLVWARRPDAPRDETVLVLVVVDEPRTKAKYGSEVAGPAARRVLEAALALGPEGAEPPYEPAPGFAETLLAERNDALEPWRATPWEEAR